MTAEQIDPSTQSSPLNDVDWNGKKITNLADPTVASQEAATAAFVEARIAALALAWNLDLNQDGSDFTNWTGAGTSAAWSSDGTVIKQTNTGAAWKTAKYNDMQLCAPAYVLEADIKAVSTGAGSTHAVGLVIGYSGAANSPGAASDLRWVSPTRQLFFSRFATTNLLIVSPFTWADDTFYKFRIVSAGGIIAAYVDGTLAGVAASTPDNSTDARYVGLVNYACEGHFKNIKGWSIALP